MKLPDLTSVLAVMALAAGAAAAQPAAPVRPPAPGGARAPAPPAPPVQDGFPFTNEALHYTINWQSGLSLGDATLTAHRTSSGWEFDVAVTAGVPGFNIADTLRASTDAGICSQELDRDLNQGGKHTREKTTFDQKAGSAHRTTLFPSNGGSSTYDIPTCARDALAFAYYARVELGQGRVPPAQQVFFGWPYTVRMDYGGAQTITVGDKPTVTDRLNVGVKGPKSDFTFEVSYARDPARTPLQIRLALPLGTISLELVR